MRSLIFALALLPAPALFAQNGAAEAPECGAPLPPPPQPPVGDAPGFSGNLFLAAPPQLNDLPRNVEIRLGGNVFEVELGFWTVVLRDAVGNELASSIDEDRVVPADGLLPADSTIFVVIAPTNTNPCQGCFGEQQFQFSTNDVVDNVAPVIDGSLAVNGYVLPSLAEQQACGFFAGTQHTIEVPLSASEPTLFTVAGRTARGQPTLLLRDALSTPFSNQTVSLSLGNDVVVTLGEPVVVIVTARDLAGNVATPRALRVRMRSFRDRGAAGFVPFNCDLDAAPVVTVPSRLPTNPALRVVFPFEELPLALRPVTGGDDVSLVPVVDVAEDARVGHVFVTARPVAAGDYDVVTLECPSCLCAGCSAPLRQRITLDDVVDATAAASPQVRDVVDDPSPPLSVGSCQPDGAATIIVLAPAADDVAGPADLLYDAVVRQEGGLPRPAGSALPALLRGNGDIAVRIPSGELGRLGGSNFTLTLTARDVGGNLSQTTYENVVESPASGCGAAPAPSAVAVPVAAVLLGLLSGLRRRRRR